MLSKEQFYRVDLIIKTSLMVSTWFVAVVTLVYLIIRVFE